MASIYEDLELAVANAIKAEPTMAYLRQVIVTNIIDAGTDEAIDEFRRALVGQMPAVIVDAPGAQYEVLATTKRRFKKTIALRIYVASNHQRSRGARTTTDVVATVNPLADPGVKQIVEQIQQLISGEDFDAGGVGRILPLEEGALIQAKDFTLWRSSYAVAVDAHRPRYDDAPTQYTDVLVLGNIAELAAEDAPNPVTQGLTDP